MSTQYGNFWDKSSDEEPEWDLGGGRDIKGGDWVIPDESGKVLVGVGAGGYWYWNWRV